MPYYDAPIPQLPYIFRLEMNTAMDAEVEFQQLQLANSRLMDRFKDETPQSE